MKVALYGRLADPVGPIVDVTVPTDGCAVSDLRVLLARQHPQLAAIIADRSVRACVDDCLVAETHRLDADDLVELMPPVSGG